MPTLSVQGATRGAVLYALRSHTERYDRRFQGNGRFARRRRQKADAVAADVLDWWHNQGIEGRFTAKERAEIELRCFKAVAGPIASLIGSWLVSLVVKLLIEWLLSHWSERYRAATAPTGRR